MNSFTEQVLPTAYIAGSPSVLAEFNSSLLAVKIAYIKKFETFEKL